MFHLQVRCTVEAQATNLPATRRPLERSLTMKFLKTLSLVLVSTTLLGSATLVRAESLTRAQVKAELIEAQRNGAVVADGQTGGTYRKLNPNRYPPLQATSQKSREQIKAELAAAQRDGTLIANVDTGATYRELAPHRFPAPTVMPGKTREEVKMELAEAIRLGDVPINDIGRTPADLAPHIYASIRAEHALAMKARKAEQTAQGGGGSSVAR
jgi:Domain of unknown function (DUF4148)